jgi:putative ABC transport system permease protein
VNFLEAFRVAIDGLRASKLRSALTMLGVIIGVASVVAVLAIAQGGRQAVLGEFEGLGSNLLWVQPNWESGGTRPITFTMEDVRRVAQESPAIERTSTENNQRMNTNVGERKLSANVYGVDENYAYVRNAEMSAGRFFSYEDVIAGRRQAIVGQDIVKELFGGENPIGQALRIENSQFQIIGVLAKGKASMTGMSLGDDAVLIPITALTRLTGNEDVWVIWARVEDSDRIDEGINQIKMSLGRRYLPDKFQVNNMGDIVAAIGNVSGILTSIVGGIAGISLLVGGIGIMNIMLVSVTERTREIGLRKAIGARRRDIMTQFLIEAVVLSGIGGVIGLLLGGGLVLLVSLTLNMPSLFTWWSAAIAILFSAGIGIIFGLWPASKAAKLDPIEALRYE